MCDIQCMIGVRYNRKLRVRDHFVHFKSFLRWYSCIDGSMKNQGGRFDRMNFI
nr:MAG TPA: hypothetical protein [Caudoviricetes sp.]